MFSDQEKRRIEKLLTALFLALSLFAATYAHTNQGMELARAEERLLDERRLIGWWMMDDNGQLYFVKRQIKGCAIN
jgi:hypothetical protein